MIDPTDMARLHKAAFLEARPWSAAEFSSLLSGPATHALGDSRAFALFRVVLDEAELLTIATDPAHQRKGHARALMGALHGAAASHGAACIFLEVAADNRPARALYADLGYVITGTRPRYYARSEGPDADAVLMSRALT